MSKGNGEVITVKEKGIEELLDRLSQMPDERRSGYNKRHSLVDILFICICATICKMETIEEIVLFAQGREDWLHNYICLENGIPSYSTFERVLRITKPKYLEQFYREWISELLATRSVGTLGQVAIDGKTVCGASAAQKVHMLSAWAHEYGLSLGQVAVDEKTNEITAIPELLDALDLRESVVTIDAIGCQKAIAEKIIDNQANYVLALKGNQPMLYDEVKEYVHWVERKRPHDIVFDHWRSRYEKGHGRLERRTVTVCNCQDWPGVSDAWKGLQSVVRYECERAAKGVRSIHTQYYISSLQSVSAQQMAEYLRNHWSIENNLHWMLDVNFGEDACLVRTDHSPQNLNILRKCAMVLLKEDKSSKRTSLKGKMTHAALDTAYLDSILLGF